MSSAKAIERDAKPSATYADKVAHSLELLASARAEQAKPWAQAHSLGAEDVVVTHLLQQANWLAQVQVFVLDTGLLHGESIALIARLERQFDIRIQRYQPESEQVVRFVQRHGERAMYQSLELRKACCDLRKMQPLEHALSGKAGWLTGLRKEQSVTRAELKHLEHDGVRAKLSPLVDWTWGDVWHCIAVNQLPYNPLHDAFYPSIGCAPCTRAITLGEDFRAGRWWWESPSSKECGLHVPAASDLTYLSTVPRRSTL